MTSINETQPVLNGVRVVNAGQILAAPFCATILAEFGAEVIKVERPDGGDPTRGGLRFEQENRGHKGVTLNLKSTAGQSLFRRLCNTADILVENYRPGTLEKFGLSPETLRETNPGLVVVRISGYGQTGPYSKRASVDRVALGFSGITAITGDPDRRPVRPGYSVADYTAGIFAAFGALAALRVRDRTGQGQDVDVALYEAVWKMSGVTAATYGREQKERQRSGNFQPGVVPAEQFKTADGHYLIISAPTRPLFKSLCKVMGQPEIASDPRFDTREKVNANPDEIHNIVNAWVCAHSLEECLNRLNEAGIPASKVYSMSDIVNDPHYEAREQIVTIDSEPFGPIIQPGIVPRLEQTPGKVGGRAPLIGEHNEEIYGGILGLSREELASLDSDNII